MKKGFLVGLLFVVFALIVVNAGLLLVNYVIVGEDVYNISIRLLVWATVTYFALWCVIARVKHHILYHHVDEMVPLTRTLYRNTLEQPSELEELKKKGIRRKK